MDNIKAYLEGLSGSTAKFGAYSWSGPRLITGGDSNGTGIAATQITTEWGYLLQQALITAGITNLDYVSVGAANRQETQEVLIAKAIADYANAATGRVIYAVHLGENDLNGVTNDSGLITRYQTLFSTIRGYVTNPEFYIVLYGIPARTDISGTTLTNYDTYRSNVKTTLLGDTTLGGRINGYVDVTGDSVLGANGASNTTTYFNGDKVHYNSTGNTRLVNGTDGAGRTMQEQCYSLLRGQGGRMAVTKLASSLERGVAIR
jgi:hypothetical protein